MKKVFVTALQLAVTIAVLIWVFHDPEQRHKMGKALQEAHYRWVAAAIVAYVIVEIAAAIRWQILLRVQKIRLNVPRLIGLFLIGMVYNQFLPGGTGGRFFKSYLLLKETPAQKPGALPSLVFHQFIGLLPLGKVTAPPGNTC